MLLYIVMSYTLCDIVLHYNTGVLQFIAMAYDKVCMGFWVI